MMMMMMMMMLSMLTMLLIALPRNRNVDLFSKGILATPNFLENSYTEIKEFRFLCTGSLTARF